MSLGPAEVLVILVIALLVFGPQRLPEMGRQVGRAVRELRSFQRSLRRDLNETFAEDVSDRAEPPPTLPPLGEDAPAAQTGDPTAAPDVEDTTPPPAAPTDPT